MSRLRVTCIEAIVTDEGDLIVAGTPGTVRCWVQGDEPLTSDHLVDVRWDHYLFVGSTPPDDAADEIVSNTSSEFCAPTTRGNLRWYGGDK